jgi:esterase/lipase superfamily enzyme
VRNLIRLSFAVACALALAGCVTPKNFDTGATTIRTLDPNVARSKNVYFVTTRCNDVATRGAPGSAQELFAKRCWEASLNNEEMHRLGFGMADSGKVSCGTATIDVAAPGVKGAVTTVATPVSAECLPDFAALRQQILATPCHCAFVFVHGYNTTLGFGLRRTAQLALDLSYEGVPILFSFAAGARLNDYANDLEAAELAAPALNQLLVALTRSDGSAAPQVDVIAQSLGSRITLRAIVEGARQPSLRYLVLAAPDIDPSSFLRLAQRAVPHAQRLTVYTAKYDVAMAASASVHAGRSRTGEGLGAAVASDIPRTEIIDATARATDPYAHSYFAEAKSVLDDMKGALQGKPATERRPLRCEPAGLAVSCTIPCPDGASCGPTLYARFVHWLLD